MLQTIREYTQGWIAQAIISLVILSFAIWGIHSYLVSGVSNVAATVNGEEISNHALTITYERLKRQLQLEKKLNMQAILQDEGTLKAQALNSLINLEVLKQGSIAQGFF